MKAKMILFLILIPSVLFSATRASASPDVGARTERQRYIMQAAKTGSNAVVVEVFGNGEYAATISLAGESSSELAYGWRHGVVRVGNGDLLSVAVAAMNGGATCRIYDHTGKVLKWVDGGNAVSCTWANR